jgi:hypothetical protein
MIISASYRTDIPAFFAPWFQRRYQAGYCLVHNPYSGKPYKVSLLPEDVTGIVFWTRNASPFTENLRLVADAGIPFIVSYTLTGYPRILETSGRPRASVIDDMQKLRDLYGPAAVVWRYDPILFTSLTPLPFHYENFASLAQSLRNVVDEVVVSFAQIYQKTERNLQVAAEQHGLIWDDPAPDEKQQILRQLAGIAGENKLRISLCAQRELLVEGVADAACVDAGRLSRIAGRNITVPRKPHRNECGCFASRDIGEYDTCPYGCVYCYAVRNQALARKRFKNHNPDSEFLYG